MAVDGCGVACKYILFIFNLMFTLVAFVLLFLGFWLKFRDHTDSLHSGSFVVGVSVMIGLGSAMLIVAVFGDHGACSEKICSLSVFVVLVLILLIAEVVFGALVFSGSFEIGIRMAEFYTNLYYLYVKNNGDPVIGIMLTCFHNVLHCCGITGVPIIELAQKTCPHPDGFMEKLVMPNCPSKIINIMDSNGSLVTGAFVGTGALLITALVCAGTFLRQLLKTHQEITEYYRAVY